MRFTDPIYPITDVGLSGLSHTEQVTILLKTGVRVIQLREKRMPTRAFAEDARAVLEIAREAGVKIIINDRVDIALAIGADGVHLGQTDLLPSKARSLLGKDAIIGFSTHNASQAAAAVKEPVDYIAAGPVFRTSTKPDAEDAIGLDTLLEIRRIVTKVPLVAIGGIGASNVAAVAEAGADAAALIGSLFAAPDGIESSVELLRGKWINKHV